MTDRAAKITDVLCGFPPTAVASVLRFEETRQADDLNRVIDGVVLHLAPSIAKRPSADAIGPECRLVEDLGIDSMAFVEMNFIWEDLFGYRIEESRLSAIVTLGDLYREVQSLQESH